MSSAPVLPYESPPERPLPPFAPIAAGHRIAAIDVIRGVAVLGILIMNIQSFAMPTAAYVNPYAYGDMTGVNGLVRHASHVLAEGKFISTFAMLFGAGLILRDSRGGSAGLHYRRMLVLLAIGLLHAYGLWYGDILVTYALLGSLAYLLRNLRPRTLAILAGLLYAAGIALMLALGAVMLFAAPEDVRREQLAGFAPGEAELARELAIFRGPWLGQLPERALYAFFGQTFLFLIYSLPFAGAMMLAGMALMKRRFFEHAWPRRRYAAIAITGCLAGWTLSLAQLFLDASSGHDVLLNFYVWSTLNLLSMPLAAIGYAAGILWLVETVGGGATFLKPFAAVGRAALTCYLLQTLICTTLFYGHGLGYFGSVSRVGQLGVVVAVWAVLLVAAPLWFRYFRFGPAECAWRSASYGKWIDIRGS